MISRAKECYERLNNNTKYTVNNGDCTDYKIQFSKAPNLPSSQHTGIWWNLEPLNHLLPLDLVGEGGVGLSRDGKF